MSAVVQSVALQHGYSMNDVLEKGRCGARNHIWWKLRQPVQHSVEHLAVPFVIVAQLARAVVIVYDTSSNGKSMENARPVRSEGAE